MFSIARAPLRVSLFGGGTDYPEYFQREPGAVVGIALDRYIYIAGSVMMWIADYKYRISYSKTELVNSLDDIVHPVVRETLKKQEFDRTLDLSIFSDIPARTGLGSSSTFTVCLLKLLSHMQGETKTPLQLAREAHHIEHNILEERVGVQDQLHAAYGGVNRFDFFEDKISCMPVRLSGLVQDALASSMFLVFTGKTRSADEVLQAQIDNTSAKKIDKDLRELYNMVGDCVRVLESARPADVIEDLGRMLHEGWQIKKRFSPMITNDAVNDLYDKARAHGATGGKLCGAGSGGFMLVVVPQENRQRFVDAMNVNQILPLGIDRMGACIVQQVPQI